MPLGIVNDAEFEKEIQNNYVESVSKIPSSENSKESEIKIPEILDNSIITSEVLKARHAGRNNGDVNVPESLRKLIGEAASIDGRKAGNILAAQFGISESQVSNYKNGETSPDGKYPHEEILTYINNRKLKLNKKALNKLSLAMSLIDEQKLLGVDAKDLSSIAKDMAHVAKQMEPTVKEEKDKEPVQFHFYAPQIRNETHYETVVAKDNY